jgi:hypothetical protein
MAFNPNNYYPHRPGGPFIPALPRIIRTNFDTVKTIEDKVRNVSEFQGANEQEMQGYIQNEINRAHTDAVGLKTDYGIDPVNRAADVFDGHSA